VQSIAEQVDPIKLDQTLADLADVYGGAAPDLFDGLANAVTTGRRRGQPMFIEYVWGRQIGEYTIAAPQCADECARRVELIQPVRGRWSWSTALPASG
jgi:hypothetical protein